MGACKGTGRASGATGYPTAEGGGRSLFFVTVFGQEVRGGEKMKKRITVLITALVLALSMSIGAGVAFGDPDCAPPTKQPCHDPGGPPGPGNFVGPGGGSKQANHH